MIGRLIVALLMIAAAAIVTMERETAVVADMTADLAESKYNDAEDRAQRYEKRAKEAEAKLAEIQAKNAWLEGEIIAVREERELALLPLETKMVNPSIKGARDLDEHVRVAKLNSSAASACFARAPSRGPELTIRWVVRHDGRVMSPSASAAVDGFENVIDCLTSEIATWRYSAVKDGLSLAEMTWTTKAPVEKKR